MSQDFVLNLALRLILKYKRPFVFGKLSSLANEGTREIKVMLLFGCFPPVHGSAIKSNVQD